MRLSGTKFTSNHNLKILEKIKLGGITLKNRIVVSPMCQYSASKGCPTLWHYNHLAKLTNSGAGMLMIESTAINKSGKISHADLCLYNSKQEKEFKKLLSYLRKITYLPTGLQVSHSGRKGSAFIPWVKKNTALDTKNKKWKTYAPSSISRHKKWPKPEQLSDKKINQLINDFKKITARAKRVGFDGIELHMAHGYLLHQFLSQVSNQRSDKFGGNLKNRCSLPLKIAKEMRKIWPKNKILGARITGVDHLKNGIKIEDSVYLANELKKIGFNYVCVSSGGIIPVTNLKFKKSFRTPISRIIKKKTSIITRTSGLIDNLQQANKIIKEGKADIVAMGRVFIRDPMWIYKAVSKIKKIKDMVPNQYRRCF